MGFGISGLINKYTRPALIKYYNYDGSNNSMWGVNTIGELMNRSNYIAGLTSVETITPDVKKSETHGYQSNVTQMAMEDGSIVSEHIIQQPITVSLQFEETNNTTGGRIADGLFGPKKTFDQLVKLWENKTVCEIITEHKIYENMVIQNMPIQHRAPYRGSLSVSCEFTQMNFAKPVRTMYVSGDSGVSKAASSTVSGGQQQMKKP